MAAPKHPIEPATIDPHETLFSVEEIARRMEVCKRTVWRMVSEGKFPAPAIRQGRLIRWRAVQFDEWVRLSAGLPALLAIVEAG